MHACTDYYNVHADPSKAVFIVMAVN
jgi:hypothetical protein